MEDDLPLTGPPKENCEETEDEHETTNSEGN